VVVGAEALNVGSGSIFILCAEHRVRLLVQALRASPTTKTRGLHHAFFARTRSRSCPAENPAATVNWKLSGRSCRPPYLMAAAADWLYWDLGITP